jgi:DNA-3-methyladenine glycosylase
MGLRGKEAVPGGHRRGISRELMTKANVEFRKRLRLEGYRVLSRGFYLRDPGAVARGILGKYLARYLRGTVLIGRIVEAEAYYGSDDPASHAFRGMTQRNRLMFGMGGRAYIYLAYGNHFLLNIVRQKEGIAGAVLVRAVEPVEGIEEMARLRRVAEVGRLTNGPGRLTQALAIDARVKGCDLTDSELVIRHKMGQRQPEVAVSPRIGISRGKESYERYYIPGNRFVSIARRLSRVRPARGGRQLNRTGRKPR